MARGSLAKVRWRNDRIRKAKARQRRRMTAGTKLGTRPEAQEPAAESGQGTGGPGAGGQGAGGQDTGGQGTGGQGTGGQGTGGPPSS
jgi:hypothetical protein